MNNQQLEDVPKIDTFAHSGTRWARNPTCWRYMDLLSLIAILQNETLHFSHIADLYKYDPEEGTGGLSIDAVKLPITPSISAYPSTPKIENEAAREIAHIKAELEMPLSERIPLSIEKVKEWDKANRNLYISSWHANDIESDFMWRVYGKEYGFAVVSSVHDLVQSLNVDGIGPSKIGFGFVVYPTRDELIRDKFEESVGSIASFMIKPPEYSPENEFRLFLKSKRKVQSCDMRVDLTKLIHSIQISPLIPSWAEIPLLNTLNPICLKKGLPEIQRRNRPLRNI